jgi:hypothetical protein
MSKRHLGAIHPEVFHASTLVFSIALSLLVVACGTTPPIQPSAEDRTENSALRDSGLRNEVVYTNLQVTQGQDIWDDFVTECNSGEESSVRISFHTDATKMAYPLEFRGEINASDSALVSDYYADISFDGTHYNYSYTARGEICVEEYKYMARFSVETLSKGAAYNEYVVYVLLNDKTVTWDQIVFSHASSQYPMMIDHRLVYVNMVLSQ